jgi:hypothetical protein
MSTIRTKNISHPSATTSAITLNADGSMGGSFPYPNRNLLYNGAMQVHQRGISTTSITTSGYYTADRWNTTLSSLGTWTQTVENDAPTGSGFKKSLKVLCTTANASPAAGDNLRIIQFLEGFDVQRIAKGTLSAQQLTLSFWVKSNVIGTYIAELFDNANTRQVSISYSVNASATWEKKNIVFPADTIGEFLNNNSQNLVPVFWLGAGTNFTSGTLQTAWTSSTNSNRAVGVTNLAAATNNYWQITGVQLETGPVATDFEFEPYGVTLAKCQRYYCRFTAGSTNYTPLTPLGQATSTTAINTTFLFPTTMRTGPTAVDSASLSVYGSGSGSTPGFLSVSALSLTRASTDIAELTATVSGATLGGIYRIQPNNAAGFIGLSAEL